MADSLRRYNLRDTRKKPQGVVLKRWQVEYSKLISNQNRRIPLETVKNAIRSAFEDGMFEQWRITLKCLLSGQRIKVPARYADCTHIECFDLEAFLRMKTQKNLLVCPICQKEVEKPMANLRIDKYIETVLSTMHDAMQVELLPDGSFTEVCEKFVVVPNVINDEEPYVQDSNMPSFDVKPEVFESDDHCITLSDGEYESIEEIAVEIKPISLMPLNMDIKPKIILPSEPKQIQSREDQEIQDRHNAATQKSNISGVERNFNGEENEQSGTMTSENDQNCSTDSATVMQLNVKSEPKEVDTSEAEIQGMVEMRKRKAPSKSAEHTSHRSEENIQQNVKVKGENSDLQEWEHTKKKRCKFFLNGRCLKAAQCLYAHPRMPTPVESHTSASHAPSPQPTPEGSHTSAHNARQRQCKHFARGRCLKAAQCLYAHTRTPMPVESHTSASHALSPQPTPVGSPASANNSFLRQSTPEGSFTSVRQRRCKFFAKGCCVKGMTCSFAHTVVRNRTNVIRSPSPVSLMATKRTNVISTNKMGADMRLNSEIVFDNCDSLEKCIQQDKHKIGGYDFLIHLTTPTQSNKKLGPNLEQSIPGSSKRNMYAPNNQNYLPAESSHRTQWSQDTTSNSSHIHGCVMDCSTKSGKWSHSQGFASFEKPEGALTKAPAVAKFVPNNQIKLPADLTNRICVVGPCLHPEEVNPRSSQKNDLCTYFSQFGNIVTISINRISSDMWMDSKVVFDNCDLAAKCIQQRMHKIGGHDFIVYSATPTQSMKKKLRANMNQNMLGPSNENVSTPNIQNYPPTGSNIGNQLLQTTASSSTHY